MLSDKEQKKEFKKLVSKTPEKYFAVNYLKKEGFKRSQCNNCKKFWRQEKNSQKKKKKGCGKGKKDFR